MRFLICLSFVFACNNAVPDDTSAPIDTGTGTGTDQAPLAGLGTLTGDCWQLDTELADAAPSIFRNDVDLGAAGFVYDDLTDAAKAVHDAANLGGSSILSEALAVDVLARCEGAGLLKTEAEIVYDAAGKRTDELVTIDGSKVGVSVVRAFKYPPGTPLEIVDATDLLNGKLSDILDSSAKVSAEDAWVKQILSVVAYDDTAADSVEQAWATLDASVKADTIVYVTVTSGQDADVY